MPARDERHALAATEPHDLLYLNGRSRQDDRLGRRAKVNERVRFVRQDIGRGGKQSIRPDDVSQFQQEPVIHERWREHYVPEFHADKLPASWAVRSAHQLEASMNLDTLQTYLFLLGRVLYGGFFVLGGINHFQHLGMMAGFTASKGVPAAKPLVLVSGLLILVGGQIGRAHV